MYYFSKKTDKNAVFTTFFIEKLLTIAKNHATIIVYRNRGKGNVGMLIFILVPFMIAYIKGYRIRSALRIWDLYPFFLSCACHTFFIINAWCGNHSFVRFSDALQWVMIATLVLPVLVRGIVYPTFVGVGMTVVGTLMNEVVIRANGGKMPVYPTVSKWIGYYQEGQLDGSIDQLHVLMDGSTRLAFLADYIDFGLCILSPGDLLIHAFASVVIYYTIKSVAKGREAQKKTAT